MEKKEFKAAINKLAGKNGLFDREKAAALPLEEKNALLNYLVRLGEPILQDLIMEDSLPWLHSMGYGYLYTNKAGFAFNGTCLHKIKYEAKQLRKGLYP